MPTRRLTGGFARRQIFAYAVAVCIAFAALALAASGFASSGTSHSPGEVEQVFAAHGLRLMPARWTFSKVYSARLSGTSSADRRLNLSVVVWTSEANAKAWVSDWNSISGNPRTARVDNVTVSYALTPQTSKLVSQVKTALAAVAKTPGVKPPA